MTYTDPAVIRRKRSGSKSGGSWTARRSPAQISRGERAGQCTSRRRDTRRSTLWARGLLQLGSAVLWRCLPRRAPRRPDDWYPGRGAAAALLLEPHARLRIAAHAPVLAVRGGAEAAIDLPWPQRDVAIARVAGRTAARGSGRGPTVADYAVAGFRIIDLPRTAARAPETLLGCIRIEHSRRCDRINACGGSLSRHCG
jgi:hypothetical protein